MKIIDNTKKLHSILLEIGLVFHKICTKNNIPYYMLGGTMLGAVRHKGFIPWDDDMDFGIPRDYVQKFKEVCKKELPSPYVLYSSDDRNIGLDCDTMKIVNTSTLIEEINRDNKIQPMGIFIDIFPLDTTNNNWTKMSRNKIVSFLLNYNSYKYRNVEKSSNARKLFVPIVKLLPFNTFRWIAYRLIQKEGDFYSNYGGYWGRRETILKSVFGKPKLYVFENIELFGVEDYDSYLKSLYNNYMELPPEDKRHIHIENMYELNK